MKKYIAIILLIAVVLSCCACSGKPAETTTPNTQPTEIPTQPDESGAAHKTDYQSAEYLYGHINQLEPVDGVYKIWNEVGVQNMVNHPEGIFELLCHVDMQGATVQPIGSTEKPFTGQIKGGSYRISNFTLQGGSDESFGFVAVNAGDIHNLILENVTYKPNQEAKYIGTLAGSNNGKIRNCIIESGSMTVETAAADAACGSIVGLNTAELKNNNVNVDLTYCAPGHAAVSGIAGISNGGVVEYCHTNGRLEINGENKTTGLFAGKASDVTITGCLFGGAVNSLNGVIFDDCIGAAENAQAVNSMRRDNHAAPLTEGQAALRDKVVATMLELGTVEWKLHEELSSSYPTKYTYYGLPYNSYSSSAERFYYCVDENNYVKDWVYDLEHSDGFKLYFGSDCSSSVLQAWWTVSNTVNFHRTGGMLPALGLGCLPVGDWEWQYELEGSGSYSVEHTDQITKLTGEQRMYEAYAQMRRGDAIMYQIEAGGHTRILSSDPVVIRDDNGQIVPNESYVLCHEQGSGYTDEVNLTKSTWRIDFKYYFSNFYYDGALPLTCEELVTGVMDPVECKLEGGTDGYAGMFSGTVEANYQINSVTLKITDSRGEVALEHPLFPSVERTADYNTSHHKARNLCTTYHLNNFATVLQGFRPYAGEEYTYTITASLATGDKFELKADSFTLGSVQ